jgi:hypothetical protein
MAESNSLICVHLDLKGVMFKPAYLPTLLQDLKDQGVNAVLVEYETVFPFKNLDATDLDRSTVLTKAQLNRFLAAAKKLDIQVIPLQQCLGHLEYILFKKPYRHLAEDPKFPCAIKTDLPEAFELVRDMLQQMIDAHPDSKYVHLGLDEAHSLSITAARTKSDVLTTFIQHLRKLLAIVEPTGKIPIIWVDMLQDHYEPGAFDEFKGRVIFSIWDYTGFDDKPQPFSRLGGGQRVSREWLAEPENPAAPFIGDGTLFIEDLPKPILSEIKPYQTDSRHLTRNFYLDFFAKQGLECLPASALRMSANYSTLPPYNQLFKNVRSWSTACKRVGKNSLGQIGTAWARGRSYLPPNLMFDLLWPIIHEMSSSMGANPKPFWPDLDPKEVDLLIRSLGRTREDWRLENKLIKQMQGLLPKVKTHRHEWQSLLLMTQVLQLQRKAELVILEADFIYSNDRTLTHEWQRRIDEQKAVTLEIAAMRKKVMAHFSKRYHGEALNEWDRQLWAFYLLRLKQVTPLCKAKIPKSKKRWGI